jgi:hypothetical protein
VDGVVGGGNLEEDVMEEDDMGDDVMGDDFMEDDSMEDDFMEVVADVLTETFEEEDAGVGVAKQEQIAEEAEPTTPIAPEPPHALAIQPAAAIAMLPEVGGAH